MITFSKLEKKGNIGNQLFQIAASIGIAVSNNQSYCFPVWSFQSFFKNKLPILNNPQKFQDYQEQQFHFERIALDNQDYDLLGWFQSEKYFDINLTKKYFEINETIVLEVKKLYKEALCKKTILISIRRGDFVDHLDYFQLPINYYINALIDNFDDWENSNLIILSDDINYCKFHFSFLKNVYFSENLSIIQQFALSSLCDDFIISNSTFSWWCAWLGEKKESKIIRPLYNFSSEKNLISNDKDFFPERWVVYNHLEKKIKMDNALILIKNDDAFQKEYFENYFSLSDSCKFLNQNQFSETILLDFKQIVVLNNFIIPPFSLYCALKNSLNKKNSYFFLKGKTINVSKKLNLKLLKKQFDFGIFTKIMSKNNRKNNSVLLFSITDNNFESNFNIINSKFVNKIVTEYEIFYTYVGKIKSYFGYKYYIIKNKEVFVFRIKYEIKKILKLFKNK